uniref:uncharacterized protein LOC122582962 n=1 Tax=Erigeron canadensis TaxID=72917 RepID=UPI001CB91453|nr:uncharacterized protein LOC122582962 [Erigeron canadensis]
MSLQNHISLSILCIKILSVQDTYLLQMEAMDNQNIDEQPPNVNLEDENDNERVTGEGHVDDKKGNRGPKSWVWKHSKGGGMDVVWLSVNPSPAWEHRRQGVGVGNGRKKTGKVHRGERKERGARAQERSHWWLDTWRGERRK